MASYRKQPEKIIAVAGELAEAVEDLSFAPPVTHVYNPLVYAWTAHRSYLETYAGGSAHPVLLLGMNPGPWGMAQTGVPFGEVTLVRDWMGIRGTVERPRLEHPKRPVKGFECGRSEASGRRLWGWARKRFHTPEAFFERFFVANYCPLMFLEATGRNRTPDRLPRSEREPLIEICDDALRRTVEALAPSLVVGVGRFAEARASVALADLGVPVGRILHPSPANPKANRDWEGTIEDELEALGVKV